MTDKPEAPPPAPLPMTVCEITATNEPWTEVILADGTKLRTRLTISAVRSIDGQIDPATGQQAYSIDYSMSRFEIIPPRGRKAGAPVSAGPRLS